MTMFTIQLNYKMIVCFITRAGRLARIQQHGYQIAQLLFILLFFANPALSQDDRVQNLSGTYFIEDENSITRSIKRRITIEEEIINDNQSMVSILNDGQEVFSGRRYNHALEISGSWNYVYSSNDPKEDGLQIDRPTKLLFSADGGQLTVTMTAIKVVPTTSSFMEGMSQALSGNRNANEYLKMTIALDNGRRATPTEIKYIRKRER